MSESTPRDELLEISCPRCSAVVLERFYGPCAACRDELSANMGREARDVEFEQFVPKMNVVANHVATKD